MTTVTNFADLLIEIEQNETNYDVREGLVYKALALAKELGFKSGVRFDPTSPDWPVFCIELPDIGEVAWHCPAFDSPYVEYDTETKYSRCHTYVNWVQSYVKIVKGNDSWDGIGTWG
jgi:hypothetical protein